MTTGQPGLSRTLSRRRDPASGSSHQLSFVKTCGQNRGTPGFDAAAELWRSGGQFGNNG
ncbi:MAG: hypothetical protein ACK583_09060 [Cyanobacteriota bacterium]